MQNLINRVEAWADNRGILKHGTPAGQASKTIEEVNEFVDEIVKNNKDNIMVELGDIVVTLIIQAKMQGVEFRECLELAINKIEKRSGEMINGVFVRKKT